MNFKINFEFSKDSLDLALSAHSVFLGSCFADNISERLSSFGLPVLANPFGTIFHPDPIAYHLNKVISSDKTVNVLQRDNVFLDWMSASAVAETSENKLVEKVLDLRSQLYGELLKSGLLVISFGTGWGYKHNVLNRIVGNCHKQPGSEFTKELFDLDSVKENWNQLLEKLKQINPDLKVVFTVSPVRHAKDGLVENNRSKARLIELTHQLCENANAFYFPAYEILIDELRDYRFYAEDLVHPNSPAIDYILEKFLPFTYTTDAIDSLKEIREFIRLRDHKAIHEFSNEELERKKTVESKYAVLRSQHPWLSI